MGGEVRVHFAALFLLILAAVNARMVAQVHAAGRKRAGLKGERRRYG